MKLNLGKKTIYLSFNKQENQKINNPRNLYTKRRDLPIIIKLGKTIMGSKIVHHKYTMDKTCPLCKKQVKAVKLNSEDVYIKDYDWKNAFQLLGCPECHNIFYHEEINPFLKELYKE